MAKSNENRILVFYTNAILNSDRTVKKKFNRTTFPSPIPEPLPPIRPRRRSGRKSGDRTTGGRPFLSAARINRAPAECVRKGASVYGAIAGR